ncbi:hypothetical protein VSX61_10080 [Brenneria populi subsp. brevivirga]|uniref:hypothetical protein n=1 Tax=Brenneria populi TaxID=1505588 RepID=UPI002E18C9BE|nr:hypothetical protein [Brenneria populi subsp. brevivirga]
MKNINETRLEVIGYGSVPASLYEQRAMSRELISLRAQLAELQKQKPFGYISQRCLEHIQDDENVGDTWPISAVVRDVHANLKLNIPLFAAPIPQGADQQSAQGSHILPVLPDRDAEGFWHHPLRIDTPFDEEGTTIEEYREWYSEIGMDIAFTDMNSVFCEDCVYGENVASPALHWNPTPPDGNGWVLTCIFDTEDGPCAEWVRYKDGDA